MSALFTTIIANRLSRASIFLISSYRLRLSILSSESYWETYTGTPFDMLCMASRRTRRWSAWVAEFDPGVSKITKFPDCAQGSTSLSGSSILTRSETLLCPSRETQSFITRSAAFICRTSPPLAASAAERTVSKMGRSPSPFGLERPLVPKRRETSVPSYEKSMRPVSSRWECWIW